jgi:16S rRNA (guanine527-N7)-methyltransferase
MDSSQISRLLQPFVREPLSALQLGQISTYIDLLLRWNERINLTAVRDQESIVTRHFGESLFAAQILLPPGNPSGSPLTVLDIGSGAGFPGIPIKLWAPDVSLTLIESTQKKATFLREVIRSLGLTGASVFADRAQVYPGDSADLVTVRAVERFTAILPIASRLVAQKGRLALLIGAAESQRVLTLETSFQWQNGLQIPLSSSRLLRIGNRR